MVQTLIQLVEQSVSRFGPRSALLVKVGASYERWTYTGLWEVAGKVACLLQQRGLQKGDRVLLWGPNCPQWVLAFLGCMRTATAIQDGWLKTGDVGFIDEEGFLHLRGRKKDVIVLPNGQNVFPEDIEAVLRKHPAVIDATVVGLPKRSRVEVHAALLLKDQAASEVVSWTNQQLADHQRIRGFTLWPQEDFPRTHTLKVRKGVVLDVLTGAVPSGHVPATLLSAAAEEE